MNNIGDRLIAAMKSHGINKQYLLADMLCVDQSAVTRWIAGKGMTIAHAIAICEKLNLSMDWLILGSGRMHRADDKDATDREHMKFDLLSVEAKYILTRSIVYMLAKEGLG